MRSFKSALIYNAGSCKAATAVIAKKADVSSQGWSIADEKTRAATRSLLLRELIGASGLGEGPWLAEQLATGQVIAISRPEELPAEAVREREAFERFGLTSVLWVPIQVQGALRGFLAFNSVGTERLWSESIVQRLQLAGVARPAALCTGGLEDGFDELRPWPTASDISAHRGLHDLVPDPGQVVGEGAGRAVHRPPGTRQMRDPLSCERDPVP